VSKDDRFLDPDELADRYDGVVRRRNAVELAPDEWETVRSRAEQSEWGVGAFVTHEGRVLLIREERWGGNGELWVAPGGMLETDETHADGAIREVHEETGIEVETDGLAAIRGKTYVHGGDGRRFGFRFAMFDATPCTTSLAADPGLAGENIRAVEWLESLPENTYERELLVRLRDRSSTE
jgi:8-oxo-dGTP diphosphatase